ncbi:hypothetical protein ACIA03_26520 [Nocardioides sp. NPDC051685]|uniref:hypothetical protein n=1 Tax=Nocardioides sp. NPDC051685 TaxID=3364334 RepID=UPI00379949DD
MRRAGLAIAAAAVAVAMVNSNVPVAAAHGGDAEAVEGAYRAVIQQAPPGVAVHPLQGRVAGFFVKVSAGHLLVVDGEDGADLARIGAAHTVASGSWLDPRVRMPTEMPAHNHLAVVRHWSIPVTYDGASGDIRGVVAWVPSGPYGGGIPAHVLIGIGGGALGLVVALLISADGGVTLLRSFR